MEMIGDALIGVVKSATGMMQTIDSQLDQIRRTEADAILNEANLTMTERQNKILQEIKDNRNISVDDWESEYQKRKNEVAYGYENNQNQYAGAELKNMATRMNERARADFASAGGAYRRADTIAKTAPVLEKQISSGDEAGAYASASIMYSAMENPEEKVKFVEGVKTSFLYNKGMKIAMERLSLPIPDYNGARAAAIDNYSISILGGAMTDDGIRSQLQADVEKRILALEALRKQRQEEMWSNNENNASQIYLQMLSGGGVQAATQGLDYLKTIGANGLDSNRRDEYAQKFQTYIEDAAKDGAGSAKEKGMAALRIGEVVAWWQSGKGTAEQGKDLVMTLIKKDLGGADVLQTYPTVLNDYFDAIQKAAPEPVQVYVKNLKSSSESMYRTARGASNKNKLTPEQEQELGVIQADLAGFAFDLVNESTFGKLTPAEMDKKVSERVKIAVAKEFDIMQTGIFRTIINSEEKQAAKMQGMLDSGVDPVFVDTYGKENWTGKSKESIETLRNFQRKELSKKLGLSETDVGRISVTNEPTKDGRDATGSAIYSDTKTGNQYRFRAEGEKMIGEQRTSASGPWTPFALSKEQGKIDAATAATAKVEANKTPLPGVTQTDWNKLDADEQEKRWNEYNRRERTKDKINTVRSSGGR